MNAETFIKFIKNSDTISFWKCKKQCIAIGSSCSAYPAENVTRGTDDEEKIERCFSCPDKNENNCAGIIEIGDIIVLNKDPNACDDFDTGHFETIVFHNGKYDEYGISNILFKDLCENFDEINNMEGILLTAMQLI